MSRAVRRAIYIAMGILGGVASWPVMELVLNLQSSFPTYLSFSLAAGALFGGVFGAFAGAVEGIIAANRRRIVRGAAFGLLFCAVGGALGFLIGQGALFLVGEGFLRSAVDFERIGRPIARALGWSILGMAVGSAEGLRCRSKLKTAIGVLGGFLGGAIGGAVIEYAPLVLSREIARPLGLILFGGLIALFYGLIERRLCSGVLRLLNGTYKGKEFILNQRNLGVGCDPGSDIFLAEYRGVAGRHATISERRGELYVHPVDLQTVTRINDEPVAQTGSSVLKYDDVIQVGSAKLFYRPLLSMLLAAGLLLGGAMEAQAQSVRIAQIDSSRLLTQQRVDLFLSVSDRDGRPVANLGRDAFSVFESTDGTLFTSAQITDFEASANADHGVTFLLLVDNSGSMYDTLEGTPTDDASQMRMTAAVAAIRRFLSQIDNPRDRVALATFNTSFTVLAGPTESTRTIDTLLDQIERPDRQGAYTELYRGVALAAEQLAGTGGRKVVIVLSDGENYPYAVYSGSSHPAYGDELLSVRETVEALQENGAGAFGINFATLGDPALTEIVTENGGLVYDAADGMALADVYADIRERVLTEYRISYRAGIAPVERRFVRALVDTNQRAVRSTRNYFAGTLFGVPGDSLSVALLIPFVAAILLGAGVALLRFRNARTLANIEILNARGQSTQVFDLTGTQTVIGASDAADVTLAGLPDLKEKHATILFDQAANQYTVVSDQPIPVNNRLTTRRVLTAGDVIQLPGATVIFDAPEDRS